jgi:hypothetical protein
LDDLGDTGQDFIYTAELLERDEIHQAVGMMIGQTQLAVGSREALAGCAPMRS